jgi:hypothetical protein
VRLFANHPVHQYTSNTPFLLTKTGITFDRVLSAFPLTVNFPAIAPGTPDRTLNFTAAESVIVEDGQRLLSFQAKGSTVFTIVWDLETQRLASQQ